MNQRYDLIDWLRGFAVVQMLFFHFCFLLREFNLPDLWFRDYAVWFYFRSLIVIQFLLLVGVSLKIATHAGLNNKSYYTRLLQLFIYGSIISVASYFYNAEKMVIFGILQFIFVASILGLLFVKLHYWNLFLGVGLYLLGKYFEDDLFNQPLLHWIGLMTKNANTFDYVPLLPWFGIVLLGIFLGQLVMQNPQLQWLRNYQATHPLSRLLTLAGRHSLNIYILHMPIFFVFIKYFLAIEMN